MRRAYASRNDRRPLIVAGGVLGLGFGSSFDVIVLHQILQWHHLISNRVPATTLDGLQANILADGLLLLSAWAVSLCGLVLLWRVGGRAGVPWSSRSFWGAFVGGWGIFHIFDELVNHRLLGLHHINPGPNEVFWDLVFAAVGVVLLLAGIALVRAGRRDAVRR